MLWFWETAWLIGHVYFAHSLLQIDTSHKVAELYAATHAARALPPNVIQFAPDDDEAQKRATEKVLRPGALCSECAVAPICMPVCLAEEIDRWQQEWGTPGVGTALHDDGRLGGIKFWMEVWEDVEATKEADTRGITLWFQIPEL
jgi:hypothetical protein